MKSRDPRPPKRRWRDYRTAAGARPVRDFIDDLSDEDAAAISKKTQKTPPEKLRLAKRRLRDWRQRGDGRPPSRESRGRPG